MVLLQTRNEPEAETVSTAMPTAKSANNNKRRCPPGNKPNNGRRGRRSNSNNKSPPSPDTSFESSSDESSSRNQDRQQKHQQAKQQRNPNSLQRQKRQKRNKATSKTTAINQVQEFTLQYEERLRIMKEYQSKFVALDCEMVGVGPGGYDSALARVTVIDWHGEIILDEYVQPGVPVTDYRTFVSGVTEENLVHAASFEDIHTNVANILEGRILVGHGLENDLRALQLQHPWQDIRDTAQYEPMMKFRPHDGLLCPRKLRDLAAEHLGRRIQVPGAAHSPIEDALAALDLYKAVQPYFEQNIGFKIQRSIAYEQMQKNGSKSQ